MNIEQALQILNSLIATQKQDNLGEVPDGMLSADEWNAVVVVLNSLRSSLSAHSDVGAGASGTAVNDLVLFKASGSSSWTVKDVSEIVPSVDESPTEDSTNPVSSGGVYIRLAALSESIDEITDNVAYIGEDDGEGGVPSGGGGGGTPQDLTDYALKVWVIQNFIQKTSMDSTPTANSTNPVTSGGVKQYVDSHSGGGGGSTITTFNITIDFSNQNAVVCDFGTIKFSDIANAIANSDIVQLIGTEINSEQSTAAIVFTYTVIVPSSLYVFGGLYSSRIMYIAVSEGNNDSIISNYSHAVIPEYLSELDDDSTHRTVSDSEKTTWNGKAKITTFAVTSSEVNGTTTYDFGNTKFSDIVSAVNNSDFVLLVLDGLVKFTFAANFNGIYEFCSSYVIGSTGVVVMILSEGSDDSISVQIEASVLPTDAQKTEWNNKLSKVTGATANNAAALDANGNLKDSGVPAAGIPFGRVDSTSTSTAFTATVPGITELRDGICVLLENGVVTSAAGFTLNINNLGAKPSFNNMTAATRDTTIFNVNYTMLFVYDATRVVDGITGAWCCYRGYDGNTNTIGYQVRTNSSTLPVSDQTGRYRLLFTSADGSKYVPATTSTSTNATSSRAVNQRPIDPHGAIVYYSATTVLSANGNVGTGSQWQQYTLTLGYSFNRTGAALVLSYPKPVYVKCTPQADGSAIIDADTPYVQALPTTADGKIYIHLGRAYSATAIELTLDHPVYHYYNGAIRRWLGPV